MNYPLRLQFNYYLSDLNNIINSIKTNGSQPKCHSIIISHPKNISIELFINFALEQNSKKPPTNASLTILGFKTTNGKSYIFNINPFYILDIFKNAQKIEIDGSYKSLGFPMELPKITSLNLFESISILNKCEDKNELTQQENISIARLIIASSEAIRFASIAKGINDVLENGSTLAPNSFEIIGWGGHSIAS